jgi:selT/selW/selH-like putative selenoprotein
MHKYFLEVRQFIESQYPIFHDNISGGNYPPPLYAQYIAQFTSYIWLLGIVVLIGGSKMLKTLGIPEPDFIHWMENNKGIVFFGLFMLNSVGNSMITTGAFEIYLNDELIFSKLNGGHVPNGEDIISALASKFYMLDTKQV